MDHSKVQKSLLSILPKKPPEAANNSSRMAVCFGKGLHIGFANYIPLTTQFQHVPVPVRYPILQYHSKPYLVPGVVQWIFQVLVKGGR